MKKKEREKKTEKKERKDSLLTRMFQKHELVKVIGIFILFAVILTWIIPSGYFSGPDIIPNGVTRIGIVDFFLTGFYSVNYFLLQILFFLAVGAFYSVLSKTGGYKTIIEKCANVFKGKEIPFLLVSSLLIGGFTSLSTQPFVGLAFVPFIISIIKKMGLGNLTAFATTFGSILLGILGITFGVNGSTLLNQNLIVSPKDIWLVQLGIFALGYVLFHFFNVIHANKVLREKKAEEKEEPFVADPVENSSKKAWPLVVILLIVLAFMVFGYIGWNKTLEITVFENFHEWLMGLSIGEIPIISYIIGTAKSFGNWDLSYMSMILLLASFVVSKLYRIKFDQYLESIGEGFKKMFKPILLLVLAYVVFIICYWSPMVPTITNWLIGLSDQFNPFLTSIVGFIAGIFHPDFGFTGYTLGTFFQETFASSSQIVSVILNAMYGFCQFFAPTSVLLMAGLAYMNISYKTWWKYIWKFLLGLLICLLVVFALLTYL